MRLLLIDNQIYRHLLARFHNSHDCRFNFVLAILVDLAASLLALWLRFTLCRNRLDFHSAITERIIECTGVESKKSIYLWNFEINASFT